MVEKNKILALLHVPFVLVALSVVVVTVVTSARQSLSAESNLSSCTAAVEIVNPTPEQLIDDTVSLELYNTELTETIESVEFLLDRNSLGSASQDVVNSGFWQMVWDTASVNNGEYRLAAEVTYEGVNNRCITQSQAVVVQNQDTRAADTDLEVQIIPEQWLGPTNVNQRFEAVAFLRGPGDSSTDVTDSTTFTWSTTIGSVKDFNRYGDFFSGPSVGIGEVSVTAQYGGQSEKDEAFVDVTRGGNNFSYPNLSDVDAASENEGDVRLASCILERLGDQAFQALIDERRRFTSEEFSAVRTCFAERKFVIPSNLSPVMPEAVRELPEGARLAVSDFENVVGLDGENDLELSGTAEPDSEVLIYVFSEPLVLTTQSGSDGRWSYTLDDPLAPGEHEAFVLVQIDNEFQRSDPQTFEIAKAGTSMSNPNGYGLTLADNSDEGGATTTYIAGIAALVLLASLLLTRFVWFKRDGGVEEHDQQSEILIAQAMAKSSNQSGRKK